MKQIFRNQYLKSFRFSSPQEALFFVNNQNVKNQLSIEDTFGDNDYCYICYNSLTSEKKFLLTFSSDIDDDNLSFLFWETQKVFVLDTGKNIYLIDDSLAIKASLEISISLVGLYLVDDDKLLILEEASFKVVNGKGQILLSESLDLIEDFSIKENILFIQTSDEHKIFKL